MEEKEQSNKRESKRKPLPRHPFFIALCVILLTVLTLDQLYPRLVALRLPRSKLLFSHFRKKLYSYSFPCKTVILSQKKPFLYGVPSIVDIAVLHSESAVYYSDGETIRRYDLHSKKDAVAIEFPASLWASYFDFSPDGSHLAAVKSLMSYDIPEEDRKKLAPEKEIHIPERGKPFIISDLYLFTMSTREYLKIDEGVDYWRPYWSPDSRGIVYGARGSIYKFSMDSQKSELLREGSFPALSPDGIQIAYFLKGRLCWGTLFREQPEHTFEYKKITASAPWREANAAHWGTIDPLVLWSPDGKYLLFSYSGEFKFSLINQYWAGPIPMFMTDEVWSKIYILDAATEKIIYRDRIPGHNGRIIWVPKD